MCPYGISAGQCRTSTPTVQSADVTGYIVGIAILAILLAIAIVIIIIGFFTYRNKNKNHPNEKDLRDQRRSQPTSSSAGWLGTKSAPKTNGNNNGAAAPTRGAYTPAPQDEPVDSEWQQQRSPPAVTLQQGPPLRPYNFPPPPARQPPSNASTPEHNGSRREAAV
jgi:FtsZ-interacting cell division protein ZipA